MGANFLAFSKLFNVRLAMLDLKKKDAEKALGVSDTTVTNYAKGTSAPRGEDRDRVAEFLGVTRADIDAAIALGSNQGDLADTSILGKRGAIEGNGAVRDHVTPHQPSSHIPYADTVDADLYGRVGAGDDRLALEPTQRIPVSRDKWFADFLVAPNTGGRYGYFQVDGDSAAPVYFDKDLVPVELMPAPTQDFLQDTIYVFRWNEGLMLKRLRLLPNGTIKAYSLNPGIPPFLFKPDGRNFAVYAIAREPQRQQLYAAMVSRFMRTAARAA